MSVLRRFVHVIRANYAFVVFWLYLAAAGLAFLAVFTFPPLALGLVLLGALSLMPAVLLGGLVRLADRAVTRPYLRRGICPNCRAASAVVLEPGQITCVTCGCRFGANGDELDPEPSAPAPSGPTPSVRHPPNRHP